MQHIVQKHCNIICTVQHLGRSRFGHIIGEHALKVDGAGGHHQAMAGNAFRVYTQDDIAQSTGQVETMHFCKDMTTAGRVFVHRLPIARQVRPRYASNRSYGRRRRVAKVHEIVCFCDFYRRFFRMFNYIRL